MTDKFLEYVIKKTYDFMEKHKMLDSADTLIVGYSGGADSGTLLFLMNELRKRGMIHPAKIAAVHINHMIRGDEAKRDEKFAEASCKKLGVEFYKKRINVPELAKRLKLSEEEAGREARYKFFEEVAKDISVDGRYKIAVAHNANDRAETCIFNMARGTGLSGMVGIKATRGKIIRPILPLLREEIEEFCVKNNIGYINDSSNFENNYSRNFIRNKVLSDLSENINSKAVDHINFLADSVKEAQDFIEKEVEKAYREYVKTNKNKNEIRLEKEASKLYPLIQKQLISKIFKELTSKGLYRDRIEAVYKVLNNTSAGKTVEMGRGIVCISEYTDLCFSAQNTEVINISGTNAEKMPIKEEVKYYIPVKEVADRLEAEGRAVFENERILVKFILTKSLSKNNNESCTMYFDYAKIKGNLNDNQTEKFCIRKPLLHDRINIGHGAKKTLSHLFKDYKIPKNKRSDVWVLEGGGRCLWAIGVRRSADFLVENPEIGTFGNVLSITVEIKI